MNIIAFVLNILRNSLKKYFCLSRRLQLKPGKIGNKFMKYNNQEQYNNRSADTWRYNKAMTTSKRRRDVVLTK